MKVAVKQKRGLALLTPERRREIAQMGGKAAHAKGVAHIFSSTQAKAAGRKGGLRKARNAAKRAVA
jgi:general stress protein YciG